MITSVWKPIYFKGDVTNYELVDVSVLNIKKGTSAYKVIWICDNQSCKTPNKKHSISACHLTKEKMSKDIQICRSCQCTGVGNGRFGDKRKWLDLYGEDKTNKLKLYYSEKFKGNKNPSKKDSVKIKKNQTIINEVNLKKMIEDKNFELLKIINLQGKNTSFIVRCPNNHTSEKQYANFFSKNKKYICSKCYYESISLNLSDEDIVKLEKYIKIVRLFSKKEYKKYQLIINPKNLKISKKDYHIDHKFSIYEGFFNNVEPKIISCYGNLEVIPAKDNLSKQTKCSITIIELYDIYNKLKNNE